MIEISHSSAGEEIVSIGGDTFNASAMASLMQTQVEYTTKIGSDENEEKLRSELAKFPLDLNLIDDTSYNGKYFISTDSHGERSFRYERANSAASKLGLSDLGDNYLDSTDAIYNSGITMALSDSLCDCVEYFFKSAREKSVRTFFDINYREKLWALDKAASKIQKILNTIDILFFSEEDLKLLGKIFQGELNQLGMPVIERKGRDGCIVHNHGDSKHIPGVKASSIDTTGAGDIFTGSFIAKYLETEDLYVSAELANKLAAKHTEYRGGIPKEGLVL